MSNFTFAASGDDARAMSFESCSDQRPVLNQACQGATDGQTKSSTATGSRKSTDRAMAFSSEALNIFACGT